MRMVPRAIGCAQHLVESSLLHVGVGSLPRRMPARADPWSSRAKETLSRSRGAPARRRDRGTGACEERKCQLRARIRSRPPPHSSGSPLQSNEAPFRGCEAPRLRRSASAAGREPSHGEPLSKCVQLDGNYPEASIASACRNLRMICSVLCRLRFIESLLPRQEA